MTKPSTTKTSPTKRSDAKQLANAGKKKLEASLARERARRRAGLDD
jgi:hypothetical protein